MIFKAAPKGGTLLRPCHLVFNYVGMTERLAAELARRACAPPCPRFALATGIGGPSWCSILEWLAVDFRTWLTGTLFCLGIVNSPIAEPYTVSFVHICNWPQSYIQDLRPAEFISPAVQQ
jgi:hypothetical protein